jgi:hypothetical protein
MHFDARSTTAVWNAAAGVMKAASINATLTLIWEITPGTVLAGRGLPISSSYNIAVGRDHAGSQTDRLRQWRDRTADRLSRLFRACDAILANNAVWAGAVGIVLTLQIALTTLHRPWLDEWQALQLAAQSPHLSDLMFNLRYEGHPPLWYLLLRGLAQVTPDQALALPLAALAIAVPVQLTILFGAPFNRSERLMLALSEFVLFEYLTISRSMTLGIALMIAVVALWKHPRLVWLPIALLPMCDFLFGVISALFVVLRWRDRQICWPLLAMWVVSGLCAAWSIRPMPDGVAALLPKALVSDFALWLADMGTLGLPFQWNLLHPQWNSDSPPGLGGPALIGFFAVAWIELRKKPDYVAAFVAFVVTTLVFSLAVYHLSVRHITLAALLLIVLVWRKADDGAERSVWWRTWLLVIAVCGLLTAAINCVEPFDTATDAVAAINRLALRDKTWVSFPHSAGQDIAALNGMTFERLTQHCSEDFIRWNQHDEHVVKSETAFKIRLHRKVAEDGHFYLMTRFDFADDPALMHRIASVPAGYDGESYYMFSVGDGAPEAKPHNQPCNGPHPALRRG